MNESISEKEKKKNTIIKAARIIFFEKGFEKATMDEIAKKANIAKGTLYLYFSSKMDLYYSIVLIGLDKIKTIMQDNFEKTKTGLEKTVAMGNSFIEFFLKHPDYYNFIINYESHQAREKSKDKQVRESYKGSEKIFNILRDSINEGIKDGSISEKISPEKMSILLWTQTTGTIQQLKLREPLYSQWSEFDAKKILDYYIEMMVKLLKP